MHAAQDDSETTNSDASTERLRLTVDRSLTPLAAVDPAMPFLCTLGTLLGRGPVAHKLAVLKTLAAEGPGPWTLEQLRDAIDWLDRTAARKVVTALADDGVLDYQGTLRRYVLTAEGRSLQLLVDLLCQPGDEMEVIRQLDALMAYALAREAEWGELQQLFALAVGHLRGARDELEELLAADRRDTLLTVAERADRYVEQMKQLSEHHGELLQRHRFDADAGPLLAEASRLVPETARLIYRAHTRLTEAARDLRRFGIRIDRDTVRGFIADAPVDELATAVAEWARPAPNVPHVDLEAAAAVLFARLRREKRRTFVPPPPRGVPVRHRAPSASPVAVLAARLTALDHVAPIEDVVVGGTWTDAVAAHARLLQALGSHRDGMPALRLTSGETRRVCRDGVWRVAAADLVPHEGAE